MSVSEAVGRSLRACCTRRAVTWSGAVAIAASSMTTTPVQPGGQRYERGDTATLMAGVNLAAVPARLSHRAISAGEGMAQSWLVANCRGTSGRGAHRRYRPCRKATAQVAGELSWAIAGAASCRVSPELIAVSLWNENVGWNCGWLSRNTGWGWTALTQGRRCRGNLSGRGSGRKAERQARQSSERECHKDRRRGGQPDHPGTGIAADASAVDLDRGR